MAKRGVWYCAECHAPDDGPHRETCSAFTCYEPLGHEFAESTGFVGVCCFRERWAETVCGQPLAAHYAPAPTATAVQAFGYEMRDEPGDSYTIPPATAGSGETEREKWERFCTALGVRAKAIEAGGERATISDGHDGDLNTVYFGLRDRILAALRREPQREKA